MESSSSCNHQGLCRKSCFQGSQWEGLVWTSLWAVESGFRVSFISIENTHCWGKDCMRNSSGRATFTGERKKMSISTYLFCWTRALKDDFLSGPVAKNQPDNAGNTGLIPGPGGLHMPRKQLSLCTATSEPVLSSTCSATSHRSEKPEYHNWRGAPTHHL